MSENYTLTGHFLTNRGLCRAITVIPASNLSNCRLLRTYRAASPEYNCTIVEAALAAMAHPAWFPAVKIGPNYCKETLIGGNAGFNNPTKNALEEAKRVFGVEQRVSVVISLGSGQKPPQSLVNPAIKELQESLGEMALNGGGVDEELGRRFAKSSFYYRFSVNPAMGEITITDWDEDKLGAIVGHTKAYIEKISSPLSVVVDLLLKAEGSAILGQLSTCPLFYMTHFSLFISSSGCQTGNG